MTGPDIFQHCSLGVSNSYLRLPVNCGFQIIDKSFGFDTAVEEAQRAINAAHVEAESIHNGIGLVKLMGRYSGKTTFPGWETVFV